MLVPSLASLAMNLLQMVNGKKSFGSRHLFEEATFSIDSEEHVAVIGPNGAGKSTLFKILMEREELDSGDVLKSQSLRVGYLEQESDWNLDQTPLEFLERTTTTPLWELMSLGHELGLTRKQFEEPLVKLSGGYRMRVQLLSLIGREPNLMLLDEPTNFLDLESLLALEVFLQNYAGAFLLISHDREFLRKTTSAVLEIEDGAVTKYPGLLDDYFEYKSQNQEILEAQARNQQAKRKHLETFIQRFGAKASKAKQAQSKMKALEKMDVIELKKAPARARLRIPDPVATGKVICEIHEAQIGYPGKPLIEKLNLHLNQGTHLGVVGVNGAGKSTLLKTLAGRLPLLSGNYKLGHLVNCSYFAQHSTDELDLQKTVLENMKLKAHPEVTQQDVLNMAGSLLFSGDDVNKKVQILSGGEKSRVALGGLLLQRNPFLLLDEPTNHLDFDTVNVLTQALSEYPGALIVVSHDRAFVKSVSHQILEIRDGRAQIFPGTYDEYIWSIQKGNYGRAVELPPEQPFKSKSSSSGETSSLPSQVAQKFNYKEETKRLNSEIKAIQRELEILEKKLKEFTTKQLELNEELLTVSGSKASQMAQEISQVSKNIESLEENMLTLLEKQEILQKNLDSLR